MWNPPADVRQRWIEDNFEREHVAMEALHAGTLGRAGLGTHKGRIDMRAFDTPPARPGSEARSRGLGQVIREAITRRNRPANVRGVRIEGVDFTHARIPGLTFDEVVFVDCLFERALLDNAKFAACRFDGCSFARADLAVVNLGQIWGNGPPLPSRFSDCSFANATFGFTFAYGSEFERCDFTRMRSRDSHWYGVRFVDCTFAGEIKTAKFHATDPNSRLPRRPDMLDGLDLSRTSLTECEFHGLNLHDTRFPTDDHHLVVEDYPCFLEQLAAGLAQPKSRAGTYSLGWIKREQKRLGPSQRHGLVNLGDVVDPWPEDGQRELAAAFDQALVHCGQVGSPMSRVT